MSSQFFVAHTGLGLRADSRSFASIDSLKLWIAQQTNIDPTKQILMTARGKQVKLQTLLVDIFIYDRDLLANLSDGASRPSVPRVVVPEPFLPADAPDSLIDDSNLEAWQELFGQRKAWATALAQTCDGLLRDARAYDTETSIIRRATAIAVENVKQHVGSLHKQHQEAIGWATQALRDQRAVISEWNTKSKHLSNLPANTQLLRFLATERNGLQLLGKSFGDATLGDVVDGVAVNRALDLATNVTKVLDNRKEDLTVAYERVVGNSSDLINQFNSAFSSPIEDVQEAAETLAEETEAIVKKLGADYENVLRSADGPRPVAMASKTALLHTRNFIPSLLEIVADVDRLLIQAAEKKNDSIDASLAYLQKISSVESQLAGIKGKLMELDIGEEGGAALESINRLSSLPSVYGVLLVEAVRRTEWAEKVQEDTAAMAEEYAALKDDEEMRRKRWHKSMDEYLNQGAAAAVAMELDINARTTHSWPSLSRDDLEVYSAALHKSQVLGDVLKEMQEAMQALDTRTRLQGRKSAIFRNGSIHDATLGRTTTLSQRDDELLRSLASDKSKLEDRLKSSESRVRKLEDLLHRQSQIPKQIPNASERQLSERFATSPSFHPNPPSPKLNDTLSRRSSTASRRFSANYGLEERSLAQRLVKLEAELLAEKSKSMQWHEQAAQTSKVHEDLKAQVHEATSTKKDLMDNFEAQKHEFDAERRLLDEENGKLKIRLEELEEEIDRLLGSHDNARAGIDDRVKEVLADMERAKSDAAEEASKLHGEMETLKRDYDLVQEHARDLERQEKEHHQKHARLSSEVESSKAREVLYHDALRKVQEEFDDDSGDTQFSGLVDRLAAPWLRLTADMGELQRQFSSLLGETDMVFDEPSTPMAQHHIEFSRKTIARLLIDIETHRKKMRNLESQRARAENESTALRAVNGKIITDTHRLQQGSAAASKQLETLLVQLNSASAAAKNSEQEALQKRAEVESLQAASNEEKNRLDAVAARADEVSLRVYTMTSSLGRLLEQIGFSVTRDESGMSVQRISRTGSSAVLEHSQLASSLLQFPDEVLPSYVKWASTADAAASGQSFETFMRESREFDLGTFSEAVGRRVKDAEHIARKWQREARSYRDKAHRAQAEAHDKIAYRSFREGDLALFLPTRNQARSWAAFNVGAPHHFLREHEFHRLATRDWIVARILKVEERVVNLSKTINDTRPSSAGGKHDSAERSDGGISVEDDNPFDLSDGLRWYMLEAAEDKSGAPTTPGLGKSTVASAHVDARGSIQHRKKPSDHGVATRTLTKSLDSRRSSTNSKQGPHGTNAHNEAKIPSSSEGPASTEHLAAAVGDGGKAVSPDEDGWLQAPPKAVRDLAAKDGDTSFSSAAVAQSPPKSSDKSKGKAWASLWSLDLNLESGGKKK